MIVRLAVMSSGATGAQSCQAATTAAAALGDDQRNSDRVARGSGRVAKTSEVTTPNWPPPAPRSAKNSSGSLIRVHDLWVADQLPAWAVEGWQVETPHMRDLKRLWRHGRERGAARGVGVFGGPGFADDAQGLTDLLGRHEDLTDWMSTAGADLQVSAAGLEAVHALMDTWRDAPALTPNLANKVGLFLGTVLIHEISGASWHIWPNGHPVVRLTTRKDFDVTALTETRVRTGHPHLTTVLDQAAAANGSGRSRSGTGPPQ